MTFIIAIITALIYAQWIGYNTNYPIWMRAFLGIIWGLIVVYAVMY